MLIIFFSLFGIVGTYSGIPVMGALANSRVVGVFVGGLIGGPMVGFLAGLISGIHRWAIDIGGFTAFACMIATICEGTLAGILSPYYKKSNKKWLMAFFAGILAEVLQMLILLILVKPFSEAWELVKIIGIPMIFANSVGISMFIA
ncbi:MAG: sensor histidine kinase, partial [Spirochaetes bacterium]|nr:sensor histidine kinase [Spirochaetota bacterium]